MGDIELEIFATLFGIPVLKTGKLFFFWVYYKIILANMVIIPIRFLFICFFLLIMFGITVWVSERNNYEELQLEKQIRSLEKNIFSQAQKYLDNEAIEVDYIDTMLESEEETEVEIYNIYDFDDAIDYGGYEFERYEDDESVFPFYELGENLEDDNMIHQFWDEDKQNFYTSDIDYQKGNGFVNNHGPEEAYAYPTPISVDTIEDAAGLSYEANRTELKGQKFLNAVANHRKIEKFRFMFTIFNKTFGFNINIEPKHAIFSSNLYLNDLNNLIKNVRNERIKNLKEHKELTPLTVPTLFGTEKKIPNKAIVLFDEPLEFKQMLKHDFKFFDPLRTDTERDIIECTELEIDPLEFLDSIMELGYEDYFEDERIRKLMWTEAQREDEKLGRTGRYCWMDDDEYGHADEDRFEDFSVRRTTHNDHTAIYTWPTKVALKANAKNVSISTTMSHRFQIPELIPIWPMKNIEIEPPSNVITRVSDLEWPEIVDGVDEYGGSSQQGQYALVNDFPFVQTNPNHIGIVRKQPSWEIYESNPYIQKDIIPIGLLYNQYFKDVGDWIRFRGHVLQIEYQARDLSFTDGAYHRASNLRPKLPSVPQNYEILNNVEREELDSIYRNVASFATRHYGKRRFRNRYGKRKHGLRKYRFRAYDDRNYDLEINDYINYTDDEPFDQEIYYPAEDLDEINY
jgi:hypothetical protein